MAVNDWVLTSLTGRGTYRHYYSSKKVKAVNFFFKYGLVHWVSWTIFSLICGALALIYLKKRRCGAVERTKKSGARPSLYILSFSVGCDLILKALEIVLIKSSVMAWLNLQWFLN